jgi:hypothetical protein
MATRALIFVEGRVVAEGAPDEISLGSPAATFLLYGSGVRRLRDDVGAIAGVVASSPQGQGLRMIVDLVGAEPLRCFAALHGAGMVRAAARLEDVVLAQRTRKK